MVSKRGDGKWLCPLCYWSGIPGMGTDPATERKAEAWDALVELLPRLGEWERGRVLARDGRLLDWVMREKEVQG